ncbi:DinB family protein [Streptomyces sp. NPDC059687]|uniref:DinB family protein n=1 Tax=unclassified Streptomyces TaxID=2593676 RepID=UPI0036306FA1
MSQRDPTSARRLRRLSGQLTRHWEHQLRPRLSGLEDAEYLWEPTDNCWSLRARRDGTIAPDWAFPAPEPPPFTTIAWRMAHIGQTLAQRADFHFGDRTLTLDRVPWPGLTAAEGLAWIDRGYADWCAGLDSADDTLLSRYSEGPPGTLDGSYPFADVILHINREVIHHGAEVALLRDLYRSHRQ